MDVFTFYLGIKVFFCRLQRWAPFLYIFERKWSAQRNGMWMWDQDGLTRLHNQDSLKTRLKKLKYRWYFEYQVPELETFGGTKCISTAGTTFSWGHGLQRWTLLIGGRLTAVNFSQHLQPQTCRFLFTLNCSRFNQTHNSYCIHSGSTFKDLHVIITFCYVLIIL